MRKHYIDNLRNFTILLLFPVHTFMVWNDFGSGFYVWLGESRLLSTLIVLVNPWFMPLLFVLAGVSAKYALEKRSPKEFILQRTRKLLLPLFLGLLFLVPFQSLFARKFFYGYKGGLWDHWRYFFTHLTDFSGYDGAFTPGHLWFILFLYVISLFSLAVFRFLPYSKAAAKIEGLPAFGLFLLFLPVWLIYYLGNFGGFSLGKNLMLFLLGYYVLSNDLVIEKLELRAKWLISLWIVGTLLSVVLYYRFSYYGDLWVNFIGWISILALIILGKKYLNRSTWATGYLNRTSYSIYLLHQTILVALAYYTARSVTSFPLQVLCICCGSFGLTALACLFIPKRRPAPSS